MEWRRIHVVLDNDGEQLIGHGRDTRLAQHYWVYEGSSLGVWRYALVLVEDRASADRDHMPIHKRGYVVVVQTTRFLALYSLWHKNVRIQEKNGSSSNNGSVKLLAF